MARIDAHGVKMQVIDIQFTHDESIEVCKILGLEADEVHAILMDASTMTAKVVKIITPIEVISDEGSE